MLLDSPQLALGRAHDIECVFAPQVIQVILADHPAVHRPDPLSHTVFALHQLDDLFNGGDIAAVTREDFIGQWKPFRRHHQSDTDLFAVRAAVAAVSAPGLRVAFALAFKIGARDIIEQELKTRPEPTGNAP